MKKHYFNFCCTLLLAIIATSCSSGESNSMVPDEPLNPSTPPVSSELDSIALKIGSQLSIEQEEFTTRSGSSRDLIAVQIVRKLPIFSGESIHASGVFDDIDDIVFKFVKGGTYQVQMTYFPNAKDIVYNYPDGTFGAPFSYLYGLKSYKLNEPVYYSGTEGGSSGDQGPVLGHIFSCLYQTTSSGTYVQDMNRGTTPRYSGLTEDITIDENTNITVRLELCMMGIELQPENFNEGSLQITLDGIASTKESQEWNFKPGDDMAIKFQIPYSTKPSSETVKMFYTEPNGDKYLLATKTFEHKFATNLIFKFKLAERAEGGIGIILPSDDSYTDEDATFDY